MSKTHNLLRAALLAGAATLVLSGGAFAQTATPPPPPPKHHHHHDAEATTGSDRLDLLEKRVEEQAEEIHELKAQINGGASAAPAQVTASQFATLQTQVTEQAAETKKQAVVAFKPQTNFQHEKSQPTITSRDGRWTFSPVVLVQGDWASYSTSQPLDNSKSAGKDDLKSSGENFRRAQIGFQGTFDGDFGYKFVYDFGGANGDETYQGYAGTSATSGCTAGGTSYCTSTGAGTGPHIQQAWVSYKGFLDPFTFKVGAFATPANLGDMTSSDDLLFNERPSPAQLSRGLDGDDGRESVGFIGNGSIWYASLFMSGDTYGKAPLIAPVSTYGGGQEAVVGRVAVNPWQDPASNTNLHLGANFGYVIHPDESTNSSGVTTYGITFSDRPELRVDNVTFLNTGALNATSAYSAGLEAAASWGPLMVEGENFWYGVTRNDPAVGVTNPKFSGWYAEGSWVITGEPRQYNMATASFVRPSPDSPFNPSTGDWGAWELAGRYSSTNLDHDITSAVALDRVFGGVQDIASAGINFYPDDVLKFMFDFQHVQLKNIGALNNNGQYDTVEIRTQVSF
ncbi:MAG: porin [Rhizomicrobium sp.]|jgi:phosphate-selective porin OprO/OprP